MSSEFFLEAARTSNKPSNVLELKSTTEQVTDAMLYAWQPNDHKDRSEWSIFRTDTPFSTAPRLDPSNPTTIAAMWTGAVINRSRRNFEEESGSFSGTNASFREIWKSTALERLAGKCEENVENLSPRLENPTTTVSLEKIKEERIIKIKELGDEILVFAGPNGTGKDFMIKYLSNFLRFIKLEYVVHKMPDPNGKLFPDIDLFLRGKKPLKPAAAQFLFLADAFDTDVSSGELNIFNRHTAVEAMVYGPKELQTTVLSTHPLLNSVVQTIIIDRCPASAQNSVHTRDIEPRVFEKNTEQVLHQRVRYAELTKLPGFRVINADFGGSESEQKVRSVNRLLSTVLQIGIIQRQMVKKGVVDNLDRANQILSDAYWKFKEEKNIWLDTKLNEV